MENNTNPYAQLLQDAELFLKQQAEIYGNDLYRNEARNEPKEDMKQQKPKSTGKVSQRTLSDGAEVSPMNEDWKNATSLVELNSKICDCMNCGLGKTRIKFVFGVGNPNADVMFVGEAPGADEDEQGEPFVGRAGQLFNKILEALEWKREDVYIANILKCRPPNNRDPQLSEVEQCIPYLWKQIDLVQPKIMMSLGRIGAQMLFNSKDSLTKLREIDLSYRGIPMLVTYHPAALLRNPNWKRPAWDDFKKLKKMYEELKQK